MLSTICCDGLRADLAAALGAVGHADAGVEQAQVVVDLGDGADGRAWVAAGAPLVNRDRRAQALDLIHVRLFHQAEELAGVGRERLDITPLTLGIDGVERQAGLAGARQAGDDHQLVAGDLQVDVLQVVFACAADDEFIHGLSPGRRRNSEELRELLLHPFFNRTNVLLQHTIELKVKQNGDGSGHRS